MSNTDLKDKEMIQIDRIMNQIFTSTTLIIVRFLSSNFHTIMSPMDTILMSMVIVCVTQMKKNYEMAILGRRLALLLLIQTIQPFLTNMIKSDFHIQTLFVNVGIIVLVSIVPSNISDEVNTIITSVIYLYSNVLDFLVQWKQIQLTILLCLIMVFYINNFYFQHYGRISEIISITTMTTISNIILESNDTFADTRILRYSLFLIVLHVVTNDFAQQVENSILFAYIQFIEKALPYEWFITVVVTFLLAVVTHHSIGLKAWPTRVCVLICTDTIISSVLNYIKKLAQYDTIITLKTAALVVQFSIHITTKLFFSNKMIAT